MTPLPSLRLVCLSTEAVLLTALNDALPQAPGGPCAIRLDVTDPAAPDADLLARADGILCDTLPDAVRVAAPNVRWIQLWQSDGEDAAALARAGAGRVAVCTASGVHASACAEHVLALLLAFARGLPAAFAVRQNRDWHAARTQILPALFDLEGKTVGIVGAGAVGQAVGARCQAFGMRTVGVRRDVTRPTPGVDMLLPHLRYHDLILASDIVVLALPLSPDTRLMFGEDELEIMKKSAHVINVGRGGLVDETWLGRALRNRWIAGAGLDVFADEPLPPHSPFWDLPNCILTPHVAGQSPLFWPRFARFAAAQAERLLRGEPLHNRVDPRRGY